MSLAPARTIPRALPPQPSAAAQLGPWELAQLAGQGEFCTVYRARPVGRTGESADYALKVARTDRADRAACMALLAREAAVAARVGQPNLVAVLGARLDSEQPYLVQPWLTGATLSAWFAGGRRFALPVALAIARQVAAALAALADAGYRHGDVKPSNIMLSPTGHATLLDLGFACHRDQDLACDQRLWLGTPRYAAPERFTSRLLVTPQSDVYSLGVVLHWLFTGRYPGEPVAQSLVPNDVAALLKSLLATEPLRRPTASELVTALARMEIMHFTNRAATTPEGGSVRQSEMTSFLVGE